MKTVIGPVVAGLAASVCCIGPVLFTAFGAGALSAAAVKFAPYRPAFLLVTAVLLGAAFYTTYRSSTPESCTADGTCLPASRRTAKVVLWIATVVVILLVTFPYYMNLFM